MNLNKREVKVCSSCGKKVCDRLFEKDIIVPDINPDIAKILDVCCKLFITEKEYTDNMLTISGNIAVTILYLSPENRCKIYNIQSDVPFKFECQKSKEANLLYDLNACIEHIDFDMENCRKLNLKIVVKASYTFYKCKEIDIVTNIQDEEVEQKTENKEFYVFVCEQNKKDLLDEKMELPQGKPAINEILKYWFEVEKPKSIIEDDEVLVKSGITLKIIYKADDEGHTIQCVEYEIPYDVKFEIDDTSKDLRCKSDIYPNSFIVEKCEDSDGEYTKIKISSVLWVNIKCFDVEEFECLQDAYGTKKDFEVVKEEVNLDKIKDYEEEQLSLKDIVNLEDEEEEGIEEILFIDCVPQIISISYESNICIEGFVSYGIMYTTGIEESKVNYIKNVITFKKEYSAENSNMTSNFDLRVNDIEYSIISNKEIETRCIISIYNESIHEEKVEMVVDLANEKPYESDEKDSSSMIIYYVQSGEKIWDIARKYHVLQKNLIEENKIDSIDEVIEGEKLYIIK